MRKGIASSTLIVSVVLAVAACSNSTPTTFGQQPASRQNADAIRCGRQHREGQHSAAGNGGRGVGGRQAVLRPVLGRPVRSLVDAARSVCATLGQQSDLGGCASRLPGPVRRSRLRGQGHDRDRQHRGRHRVPGRRRSQHRVRVRSIHLLGGPVGIGRPTTSASTSTAASGRTSPRRRPRDTAPVADPWYKTMPRRSEDLAGHRTLVRAGTA